MNIYKSNFTQLKRIKIHCRRGSKYANLDDEMRFKIDLRKRDYSCHHAKLASIAVLTSLVY